MTKRESHIAGLISSRIREVDPDAEVILFGSQAREQAGKESDWDILILIDKPKESRSVEDQYRDAMFDLQIELGEVISTFVYSRHEWETKHIHTPLYHYIEKEGIRLS